MDSSTLVKIQNSPLIPLKVLGNITGSTSDYVVYHFKPSYPCRIIGAQLNVITASGGELIPESDPAAYIYPSLSISKAIVTDPHCIKDAIVSDVTTSSAVSDSAILSLDTGASDNTHIPANPGDDYQTAKDIDVEANEAILIILGQCTDNALVGTLILEIQPL